MATVVQWTVEDVSAWLGQCLHLPYAEGFAQAGIDGVQLVHLTHQGLLGLGVDTEEHIKCLLDHIAVLRIQWERSLSCQDAETRKSLNASLRSASADGQWHRKRMGTVWPRVGSPMLHAAPVKFHRPELQAGGLKPEEKVAVKEGLSDLNLHFAVKAEASGKVQETREQGTKDPLPEGKKDVAKAEAGEAGRVSSERVMATVDTSTRVAVGGSEPNPVEFVDGLHAQPLLLPPRSQTPLSMHGASSARCASEAVSRCSSVPASYKRGPSAAAEGGASLFLSDQSRGAFFGTTTRGVEILPDTLGPGPARYDANTAASKISLRANIGAMKFNCEPRRTMECMFVRGASGPGSGKYHPPPRSGSRGGSFSRAPRWNSRSQIRTLPASAPAPPGPGPSSYKPNHSALSTLR
eukprot:Skav209633  [mRNA]  locus=scaffold2751:45536:46759:+ [translate_table: standard]